MLCTLWHFPAIHLGPKDHKMSGSCISQKLTCLFLKKGKQNVLYIHYMEAKMDLNSQSQNFGLFPFKVMKVICFKPLNRCYVKPNPDKLYKAVAINFCHLLSFQGNVSHRFRDGPWRIICCICIIWKIHILSILENMVLSTLKQQSNFTCVYI